MQPCEVCGALKTEAHHPDYDKPLNVVWLCKVHHEQEHHPGIEKRERIIVQPKYTETEIIGHVSNVLKSKTLLSAFIKRHTPKREW